MQLLNVDVTFIPMAIPLYYQLKDIDKWRPETNNGHFACNIIHFLKKNQFKDITRTGSHTLKFRNKQCYYFHGLFSVDVNANPHPDFNRRET